MDRPTDESQCATDQIPSLAEMFAQTRLLPRHIQGYVPACGPTDVRPRLSEVAVLARRTRWMIVLSAVCAVVIGWVPAGSAAARPTRSALESASAAWPGPSPAAADWPQFMRGSYHQGVNQVETALSPTTVSSLAPVWNDQLDSDYLPNTGSPIVVGNALYVGGPDVSRRDAATGALVWQTNIAEPASRQQVQITPAYDHGIVVAATTASRSRDTIAGLNAATGAVLWKRLLPGRVWSSPSTANGVVYVGVNDNEVMAIWLRTGYVRWTWTTPNSNLGAGTVSSPTTDGKSVYFSTAGGAQLWSLDAATGAQHWMLTVDSVGAGPAAEEYTMSLLSGRLYAGTVDGEVYSIDAATGAIVWQVDLGEEIFRALVATPQAILAVPTASDGSEHQVMALSPINGHVVWTYTVPGYLSPGLSVADGVVYAGWADMAQTVSSLEAIALSTGAQLARIALPAPSGTDPTAYAPEPPAIANGRLYVPRFEELFALGPH